MFRRIPSLGIGLVALIGLATLAAPSPAGAMPMNVAVSPNTATAPATTPTPTPPVTVTKACPKQVYGAQCTIMWTDGPGPLTVKFVFRQFAMRNVAITHIFCANSMGCSFTGVGGDDPTVIPREWILTGNNVVVTSITSP